MSYIGKPPKEQHGGRVLLAQYEIANGTSQLEIINPFLGEGSLYRQHEIEFVNVHSQSNGYFAFSLARDGGPGAYTTSNHSTASERESMSTGYRHSWLHTSQSGSGSNHYSNGTPGWNIGQQNEITSSGDTLGPRDWAVMNQYSVSQNNKSLSGKLTFYNLTYNDDVTRWISQTHGDKWSGQYYQGQNASWSFGTSRYTMRMIKVIVRTLGSNMDQGRIKVGGMAKGAGATLRDGSSPDRAGETATELFKNGVTEEGAYWLNNMYTGHVPRLAYCKFNMNNTSVGSGTQGSPRGGYGTNRNYGGSGTEDGLQGETSTYHMQKWSPVHMRGYNYNGHYGSGGTCTVSDGSEIASLMTGQSQSVATNHTIYKTSGGSTNSGNKATMRLGITHRQMAGHTWFRHRYLKQHSQLGGTWDMEWALEREYYSSSPASPPGPTGNFGNNYNGGQSVTLSEFADNATIPAGSGGWSNGTFSHHMSRRRFTDDGYTRIGGEAPSSGGATMGTQVCWGAHPTSESYPNDIWDNVKIWDTLQPGSAGTYWSAAGQSGYAGWNPPYWIGLSIRARTAANTDAEGYFEFWVHIP